MHRTPHDIVLTLHPDAARDWQGVIPHDPSAPPEHLHIDTPPDKWHFNNPEVGNWLDVGQRIQAVAGGLRARPGSVRRLDVVAKSPYALGLLLGSCLESHAGHLTVWQPSRTGGWDPWPLSLPHDQQRYFTDIPALPMDPSGSSSPVILTVGLSRYGLAEAVRQQRSALGLDDSQALLSLSAPRPSSASVHPEDVGPIVSETLSLIERVAARFPKAPLHFFYSGPLTPLLYLGQKLHLIPHPILCYDQVRRPDGLRYEPILRFPERTLLPMAGTDRQQQLRQLLLGLCSNHEVLLIVASLQGGEQLRHHLPGAEVPPAKMMDAVVQVLVSRGRVDAAFFAALCDVYRYRKRDIDVVAEAWE